MCMVLHYDRNCDSQAHAAQGLHVHSSHITGNFKVHYIKVNIQFSQNSTETVYITLLWRTPASFPNPNALVAISSHVGSKTLYQQNPPVLNWRCQLTQVDLHNGHKTVVVVVVVSQNSNSRCTYCHCNFS